MENKTLNCRIGIKTKFLRRIAFAVFIFFLGFLPSVFAADPPSNPEAADQASSAPDDGQSVDLPSEDASASSEEAKAKSNNNITLDFKDADINTVLRVLSLKSKVNIVAGPEVQGTVTIRLENVPWEKALEVVLRTYDYVYERDENIVRVTTREKMAQESVVTQTYILNYTRAQEVQDAVREMLTERGRIRTAERTNTLIVTDIPTNLYRIQEVIKKLDQRTPQAFIDSKIVRTEAGVTENLGIVWNPAAGIAGASRPVTFPFINGVEDNDEEINPFFESFFAQVNTGTTPGQITNSPRSIPSIPAGVAATLGENDSYNFGTLDFTSFSATLEWLKSRSHTKIVSNPRIVVLNNQKAQVQVGSEIPLPQFERNETTGSVEITGFEYRDVGVILNVTPHINSEEEILVELAPEVSSVGDTIDFGDFQMPSFDVTIASSQVLIRSGETIAIGGLMTDNTEMSQVEVPGLSTLPFIGKLFRSKRQVAGEGNAKIETLFFITVTMVDTEGQPVGNRIQDRMAKKVGNPVDPNAAPSSVEAKIAAAASSPEVTANMNSLEPNKTVVATTQTPPVVQ